jgi:hypothetical protein
MSTNLDKLMQMATLEQLNNMIQQMNKPVAPVPATLHVPLEAKDVLSLPIVQKVIIAYEDELKVSKNSSTSCKCHEQTNIILEHLDKYDKKLERIENSLEDIFSLLKKQFLSEKEPVYSEVVDKNQPKLTTFPGFCKSKSLSQGLSQGLSQESLSQESLSQESLSQESLSQENYLKSLNLSSSLSRQSCLESLSLESHCLEPCLEPCLESQCLEPCLEPLSLESQCLEPCLEPLSLESQCLEPCLEPLSLESHCLEKENITLNIEEHDDGDEDAYLEEEVVVEESEEEEEEEVVEESEEEESEEESEEEVVTEEEMDVPVKEDLVEEEEVEEEEVEEKVEEVEVEVEEEEEELEEEEVFEIEIDDITYFATDEENGILYEVDKDGEVGRKVGIIKDGEPIFS